MPVMSSAKLEIWRTGDGAYTDYSSWLWANDDAIVEKEHALNEPQRLEFSLQDGVAGFQVPELGNRVRLTTTPYGVTFVGFLVSVPERAPLGQLSTGSPAYGYRCVAVSEELRLEWQTAAKFPTLPPFVNKYQGEIVKELIAILGGGLTTTGVDNGILIPYFRVRPEEGFMDAVRRLSDRTQMAFWTSNGAAFYRYFGNLLTFNEELDNAAWVKTQLAVSANSQANPYGMQVADRLTPTAGATNASVYQDVVPQVIVGRTFRYFRWLRAASGAPQVDLLLDNQSGTHRGQKTVTLSTTWQLYDVTGAFQSGDTSVRPYVGGVNSWVEADGAIDFGPGFLADADFPVSPSESDALFDPDTLSIQPLQSVAVNDVIAAGEVEPQAYVREYFLGDGLTGRFPLRLPLFGAISSKLLEDDFTGAIDSNRWTETDPDSVISIASNSLRFQASSVSGNNRLTAKQGVEVAGVVELRSGRVRFNGASNLLIGGLFSADTGLLANCVVGFRATPNGGQTDLRAVVSGALAGPTYTTTAGKTYQFSATVNCPVQSRRRRPYFSAQGQFGGEDVSANATVSFSVLELPDNDTDKPTEVLKHSASIAGIARFLFFTEIAGPVTTPGSADVNVNFCLLRKPITAELWTRKIADSAYVQRRLGDKADADAWASIVPGTEGHELIFFNDNIPDAREKIKLVYRAAGQARVRVRRDSSVTLEASRAGDSGVRTGVLPNIQPPPRDSAELERALQAFIDDATTPRYEGEWAFHTRSYSPASEPTPGKVLFVDATSRHPRFLAAVRAVRTEFLFIDETNTDIIRHTASFGTPLRIEEETVENEPAENALEGALDTLTDVGQVEFASVGVAFAADRPDGDFSGTVTSSTVQLDMGAAPSSAYEVRKTDAGWGTGATINDILASDPATQTFTIPRTTRDILAYIKNRDGAGLVSRYPTAIRLLYPLPPNAPTATVDATNRLKPIIKLALPGDATDVFGVEIRDSNDSTVLYQYEDVALAVTPDDPALDFVWDNAGAARSKTLYAYTYNLLGEYSSQVAVNISMPAPSVSGLTLDEVDQSLRWTVNADADETEVQVATDSGFSSIVAQGRVKGTRFPLAVADVVQTRYYRARHYDEIGAGSFDSTGSPHSYTATGVASFDNTNNVESVGFPPAPGTDPTYGSPFNPILRAIQNEAWDSFMRQTRRSIV